MNKKKILSGSILAVLLIVMTPIVNAIELNQVENNIVEKIKPDDIQIIVEKLKEALNYLERNPDDLCLSCKENSSLTTPNCKILLKIFIAMVTVSITLNYMMNWITSKITDNDAIQKIFFNILSACFSSILVEFAIAMKEGCVWAYAIITYLTYLT